MKKVSDVLENKTKSAVLLGPKIPVDQVLQKMSEEDVGSVLLTDNGRVVGVFSERDYLRRVVLKQRDPSQTLVSDVMTKKVICIESDTSIDECLALMNAKKVRHLPVTNSNGAILGFVSILDVISSLLSEKQITIENMEKYISETWPF